MKKCMSLRPSHIPSGTFVARANTAEGNRQDEERDEDRRFVCQKPGPIDAQTCHTRAIYLRQKQTRASAGQCIRVYKTRPVPTLLSIQRLVLSLYSSLFASSIMTSSFQTFFLVFFSFLALVASAPLLQRDVFVPPVLYPHAGTVWTVGSHHNVTWYVTLSHEHHAMLTSIVQGCLRPPQAYHKQVREDYTCESGTS